MAEREERHETYVIPPNFVEGGTVMGGMFKLRNAIEAGAAALIIGFPVFNIQVSLTMRIILLCLTALPVALLALMGVNGESLTSFILNFFKFLFFRRIVKQPGIQPEPVPGRSRIVKNKPRREPKNEVAALKQQLRDAKRANKTKPAQDEHVAVKHRSIISRKKKRRDITPAEYIPIEKIENGVIYTRDHRYVKIIEVVPINFLLRSAREQRNIIYSFISFLKISPVKLQFKVLTKKADINKHLARIHKEIESEPDEKCRVLQQDYEELIRRIGSKEAVTRRFFIVFEYEPFSRCEDNEIQAVSALQTAVNTAKTFLLQCGNEVIEHKDTEFDP